MFCILKTLSLRILEHQTVVIHTHICRYTVHLSNDHMLNFIDSNVSSTIQSISFNLDILIPRDHGRECRGNAEHKVECKGKVRLREDNSFIYLFPPYFCVSLI